MGEDSCEKMGIELSGPSLETSFSPDLDPAFPGEAVSCSDVPQHPDWTKLPSLGSSQRRRAETEFISYGSFASSVPDSTQLLPVVFHD